MSIYGGYMYRFGQAAAAIGLADQTLRNWLRRNKVDLYQEQPEKGWLTFTTNDVYVLALARQLVDYGAGVSEAVDAAHAALHDMDFNTLERMPGRVYFARSKFGGWEARADANMVRDLAASPTILEISVPDVLNAARKRLEDSAI